MASIPPILSLSAIVLLVALVVASLPRVTTPLTVVAVICPPDATLSTPVLVIVTLPVALTLVLSPVLVVMLNTPALVSVILAPNATVPPPLRPVPAVTVTLL